MLVYDIAEVSRLLSAADSYAAEIARQRGRLRTVWRAATEAVDPAQACIRAVDYTLNRRQQAFDDVTRNFDRGPDLDYARDYGLRVPVYSPDQWMQPNANGSWSVRPSMEEIFDRELSTARQKFIEERTKRFGGQANRAGRIALASYSVQLTRLRQVKATLEETLRSATETRSRQAAEGRTAADAALAAARTVAEQAIRPLPAPLQPWGAPAWGDWASSPVIPGLDDLYVGTLVPLDDGDLGDNAAFGSGERTPFFLSLRRNVELVYAAAERERALALARTLLIRQLAATEPGDMRLTFFDPVGLGQSVAEFLGLAEFDPDLVGGKVWSAPADLAAQLAELTAHVELVIQKYLRTTYETIDEFNAAAGETAEPYRYLVACDFPTGFTDETFGRLKSIMANGPRCGVRTLLLTSRAVTPGYGVDPAQIDGVARRITIGGSFVRDHKGYTLQMRLDNAGDPVAAERVAAAVIDSVGRRAVSRAESAVTFEKAFALFGQVARRGLRTDLPPSAATVVVADESTWWQADSTRGLFAAIGQKGARDAAILSFDSGDHAGALLGTTVALSTGQPAGSSRPAWRPPRSARRGSTSSTSCPPTTAWTGCSSRSLSGAGSRCAAAGRSRRWWRSCVRRSATESPTMTCSGRPGSRSCSACTGRASLTLTLVQSTPTLSSPRPWRRCCVMAPRSACTRGSGPTPSPGRSGGSRPG